MVLVKYISLILNVILQIHTQKELGGLLSLSSRFPAFTNTPLLVAKLSGLVLSVLPAPNISSKIRMVCFRDRFGAIP